jgi:hypothetical protein
VSPDFKSAYFHLEKAKASFTFFGNISMPSLLEHSVAERTKHRFFAKFDVVK